MGYTLASTQKAPLLDGAGNPLASADMTDPAGHLVPFPSGPVLDIVDDGAGFVQIVGKAPGQQTQTFVLASTGEAATHTITVTAPPVPFDWTLGTPVAK